MRWMISVRYVLVILSVLLGAFFAVVLGYSCSGYLCTSGQQDVFFADDRVVSYLQLPEDVAGTELTALALVRYEGTFLEDGGDTEVVDVAALLLRNNSSRHICDGRVEIKQGRRTLEFQFTHLPGYGEILVIERNRQPYFSNGISRCEGKTRSIENNNWADRFSVTATGRRDLTIKNLTQQQHENVVVYYKTYYVPAGFYVGGITHSVKIDAIGAGERIQLLPRPFISEGSLVVWIGSEE